MKNEKFLKQLESFQNSAVDVLIRNNGKLVIVKGKKFTGKTRIVLKLFEKIEDEIVIYHTGCNPKYYYEAYDELIEIIESYNYNSITIILDEFYDNKLLEYISELNGVTCYVFTNDINFKKKPYINFNYYNYYIKFIRNIFHQYFDINQIIKKDDYNKLNELRSSSNKTITNVKYNNKIYKKVMEFKDDNINS